MKYRLFEGGYEGFADDQVPDEYAGEVVDDIQTVYSTTDGSERVIELGGAVPGGYAADPRPSEYWDWNVDHWEFQVADKRQAVSEILMGLAAQILALSDAIVHDWEEQGLSGDYTQVEYDAEVAKRVTLRNALTNKFAQIKAATDEAGLDTIQETLQSMYQTQLESYAVDRLAKA